MGAAAHIAAVSAKIGFAARTCAAIAHAARARPRTGRIGKAVLHPYRPAAVPSMRACVHYCRDAPLTYTAHAPTLADT